MKLRTAVLMGALIAVCAAPSALARKRKGPVYSGATGQLYRLLDNSYGGKLADFYLLADVYQDPKKPGNELQHVLSVTYNRNLFFGRFVVEVRSIDKPTPAQLKTYTPEQMFKFAETDSEKFEKTQSGPLGTQGDLYLRSKDNGVLAPAPITDEVRTEFDNFITKYILPAVKKKE